MSALFAAIVAAAAPVAAQQRVVVQSLVDLEAWSTHGGSRLLSRNDDRPAALGRLQLWGAGEIRHDLLIITLLEVEGGPATVEGNAGLDLHQLTLRYAPARWLALDAGRFPTPFGAFAPRRLSTSNPLIGVPDHYPTAYPWGGQISGAVGRFDYRAAVVDRPMTNEGYVPKGGRAARLIAGGGFSPHAGLRVGASYTSGPYLSEEVTELLSPGESWRDFGHRALGLDGALSRGYLEIHAELVLSRYEVPGKTEPLHGNAWYLEGKYTWAPRFFTAVRLEQNKYAFIRPFGPENWMGVATKFYDGEIGLGYRVDAKTLIKGSLRKDHWVVPPALRTMLPDGHAFALQLSRGFDVTGWLSRPR
jgi:hypothetical protein